MAIANRAVSTEFIGFGYERKRKRNDSLPALLAIARPLANIKYKIQNNPTSIMQSFFGFGKGKVQANENNNEAKGKIGKYFEDENPVIVKFVNDLPNKVIMERFNSLTVVSWKYDGSRNNGMPPKNINLKMIALEKALHYQLEWSKKYYCAYSRTGNHLKELVYYSKGINEFMPLLNEALRGQEIYPIEINFYEDPNWNEYKKLLADFAK